jgi:hypothetical protein
MILTTTGMTTDSESGLRQTSESVSPALGLSLTSESNDHDSGSQPEAGSCSWTPGPTRSQNTPVGRGGSSLPPSQAHAITVPPCQLEAETASPQVGLGGYNLDSESESSGRPGLGCAPCHGVGGGPGVPVQPEQDAHGQLLRTSAKRLYDENQDLLAQNKVRKAVRSGTGAMPLRLSTGPPPNPVAQS